jgi:DNA-binding transcriptional ArsR family regulator
MKIYKFLQKSGKATVTDIVAVSSLTQPTVSYHLNEMKKAGLLQSKKVGKEVFYSLEEGCVLHNSQCILKNLQFPEK